MSKEEWCGGFWPGILWYDYEYTQRSENKGRGRKFTASLKFLSEIPAYDHDLGFFGFFVGYGNGYRLTGNPEYKQVIINTADFVISIVQSPCRYYAFHGLANVKNVWRS